MKGYKMKVTLFDAKPYDLPGFRRYGEQAGIEFKIYETKLNEDTVSLAAGSDAVCVFVNDTVNAPVIDRLAEYGVRAVALRCAGYNNVDLEHAFGKIHVMHVPWASSARAGSGGRSSRSAGDSA